MSADGVNNVVTNLVAGYGLDFLNNNMEIPMPEIHFKKGLLS